MSEEGRGAETRDDHDGRARRHGERRGTVELSHPHRHNVPPPECQHGLADRAFFGYLSVWTKMRMTVLATPDSRPAGERLCAARRERAAPSPLRDSRAPTLTVVSRLAQKSMTVGNVVEHERGLPGHVVSADASEMHMQPVPEM